MSNVRPLHILAKDRVVHILLDHHSCSHESRRSYKRLIRQLKTDRFTSVTESVLEIIVDFYPGHLDDEILYCLVPSHLRNLNLSGCTRLKGGDNHYWHKALKKCIKTQNLNLGGCDQLVTLDTINQLTCTFTLVSASLEGCQTLTNDMVKVLLNNCKLTHLNLSMCDGITDKAFSLDSAAPPRKGTKSESGKNGSQAGCYGYQGPGSTLTSVDLSCCSHLTSTAIRYLTQLCGPRLQALNVYSTQMDCTVLWYLSGYSLATTVQLAVSQDGEILDRDTLEERVVADLVRDKKILEEKFSQQDDLVDPNDPDDLARPETSGSPPNVDITETFHSIDEFVGNFLSSLVQVCLNECEQESVENQESTAPPSGSDVPNVVVVKYEGGSETQSPDGDGDDCAENCSEVYAQCDSAATASGPLEEEPDGDPDFPLDVESVNVFIDQSQSMDYSPTEEGPATLVPPHCSGPDAPKSSQQGEEGPATLVPPHCSGPDAVKSSKQAVEITQLYQPNLTSLDISYIVFEKNIAEGCLRDFFRANRNVQKFSISWAELNDFTLDFIASHSQHLKSLSLIGCEKISTAGLASLGSRCTNLQYLDIKGVCFVNDAGLAPLLMHPNGCSLQGLILAECNIRDPTLYRIAQYIGPKLLELDLSWCEDVTERGLFRIAESCTSLKSIGLRQCAASCSFLQSLATNNRQLRALNISGVADLSNDAITDIASNLRFLQELQISWNPDITDAGVLAVLVFCPELKELQLSGLKMITSQPFLPIIAGWKKWQRCKSLLKLKKKEKRLLENLGDLQLSSDEEYEDLFVPHRSLSYAPSLKSLDVEYCNRMNDNDLAELVAICRGTLTIRDYYGENIKPKIIFAKL